MTETLTTTPNELKTWRGCMGTNTAGEACGARPLKGTKLCGVHTPNHPVAANFAAGHPPTGGGRPAKKRVIDLMREKIEDDFAMIMGPVEGALTAERDGQADHAIRLQAAREFLDRAYGKPRQQVEHSGPDGGPITLAHLAQRADEDDE